MTLKDNYRNFTRGSHWSIKNYTFHELSVCPYFKARMPLHEKINYYCCLYVLTLTVPGMIWRTLRSMSHMIISSKIYLAYSVTSRFIIEYKEPRETNKSYKDLVSPHWMADISFAWKSDLPGPLGGKVSQLRKNVLTIVDVTLWLWNGDPTITKTYFSNPLKIL